MHEAVEIEIGDGQNSVTLKPHKQIFFPKIHINLGVNAVIGLDILSRLVVGFFIDDQQIKVCTPKNVKDFVQEDLIELKRWAQP